MLQKFLARILPNKATAPSPTLMAYSYKTPAWTPWRYDALAEEGYHRNVIVYRCVNLIARGMGSVPWVLKHHDQELEDHPLLTLLNHPHGLQAGSAFMETVVGHLLLSGNAYIHFEMDPVQGVPFTLNILRPDRVHILPGQTGEPAAYVCQKDGKTLSFPIDPVTGRSCVIHLKFFHPLNDYYGMSPLEAASSAVDQHNAVSHHNLSLLQNGGRPSGALLIKPGSLGYTLTQEQRESLRADLQTSYEGAQNAGRVLMLEGDVEWKELGLSPKDLDFASGKNISAREIAQAFGVPPMLVGVPGDATFANYKEARYHLWEDTILPLLEMMTAEFNLALVPFFEDRQNLKLSYDTDAIPALWQRREALWKAMSQADFLTNEEKRAALGYGA